MLAQQDLFRALTPSGELCSSPSPLGGRKEEKIASNAADHSRYCYDQLRWIAFRRSYVDGTERLGENLRDRWLIVLAGAALLETALLPGILIGGLAVLAPRYLLTGGCGAALSH